MSADTFGDPDSLRRTIRFPLLALLAAAAAIPAAAWWHAFSSTGAPAPDFTLMESGGRPFTLSAQRGHPVIVFFGYTHCPDACPTTLARLARALRAPALPPDVRVAFVTVDPARDSPAVLRRYVRLFDPAFHGLTGDRSALDAVYAAYHTVVQSDAVGGATEYSVAHTTTVYYVGRNGRLNGFGHWDDAPALIARNVRDFQ